MQAHKEFERRVRASTYLVTPSRECGSQLVRLDLRSLIWLLQDHSRHLSKPFARDPVIEPFRSAASFDQCRP
jgi:hypothetical protein